MLNNNRHGRWIWCSIILIGLLAFTLYAASEGNPFIDFDQFIFIIKKNWLNLFFLGVMAFIAFKMIGTYLHRIDTVTDDISRCADALRTSNLKQTYQHETISNACKQYLDDKDIIGRRITDYISISLLNSTISKSTCEIIGPVMTGLGLLGTFVGLIVGLHGFSADPAKIESSISLLLEGIKTSFLTSIYGVVFSLFFNRIYRKAYTVMVSAWESLSWQSNKGDDPDTRLVNAAEQMKSDFHGIMCGLSESISTAFQASMNAFTEATAKAFADVKQANHSTGTMIQSTGAMIQSLFSETGTGIRQLNESMKKVSDVNKANAVALKSASDSLNGASSVFQERNDVLHEYVSQIHRFQKNINDEQTEFNQKMQAYITSITTQQEHITADIHDLCEKVEHLAGNYEEQNQMISILTEKMTVFEEQNTRLQELIDSQKELSLVETEARSGLDISLKSVNNAMNTLSNTFPKKMSEYVTDAARQGREQFEQAYAPLHNELAETIRSFQSVSKEFQEAYQQLETQMQTGLGASFSQFDESVSDIAREFRLILEQMQGVAQNLPLQINQELHRILDEKRKQREELYKRLHISTTGAAVTENDENSEERETANEKTADDSTE